MEVKLLFGVLFIVSMCTPELQGAAVECGENATNGSPPNCAEVNECNSSPCHYGSTCIDLVNGFKCECPAGFSGSLCDLNIDECQSHPCTNNGRCLDNVNGYTCECVLGFTGMDCEVNIDDCATVVCRNGGTCHDLINDYNCSCAKGWTGKLCMEDINECEFNPCGNNGQCVNLLGSFTCTCSPGFTGERCETNIDDCTPNPCQNHGICEDGITNYTCRCSDNFMGRTCNEIYNACTHIGCKNGGTCTTTSPSRDYSCECLLGFTGRSCEINIDDCKNVICNNSQVCFDKVNDYECRCPDGFTGTDCSININECDPNPCFNRSECIDGIANFTCKCPRGYTGHRCDKDINECESNPCNSGICVNSPGSYNCYCQPGYSGDNCGINFDECLSKPCQHNGTCEDLVNSYRCHCSPGYTGSNCETDINECESHPCQNNGSCHDGVNSYLCQCVPGFTGYNCETDIDDCASTPCQNNGICKDRINGFDCNCADTGFKGEFCEINIDDCDPFPCVHDANCTDLIKDFKCLCHPGYTGKICEVDINECVDHPCKNEGLCLEKSNITLYDNNYLGLFSHPFDYSIAGGYVCHCVPGFRGENCTENIDDCDPYPCFNGTCVDGINNYTCDCFGGFEGRHCEIEVNECDRYHPCENGSTCYNTIGDYECECLPSFGGKNCSVELRGCVNNGCQNGATCIPYLIGESEHRYNCTCYPGFYGRNCEHVTTFSLLGNSSYFMDSPVNDEYKLTFQFRTTLPEGLLAFSKNGSEMFIVGLYNGMIHFQINSFQDVIKFENTVNNALWNTLSILISSSKLQLHLTGNSFELDKSVDINDTDMQKFHQTHFGSTSEIEKSRGFIGCMQDVIINDIALVPSVASKAASDIEVGCLRSDQCKPDSCSAQGDCTDLWRTFSCSCHRPHFGKFCNYSFVPATFGYENDVSRAVLDLTSADQSLLHDHVNISMFIRTRKADGLIFYLGQTAANVGSSFLALELQHGNLEVVLQSQANLQRLPTTAVRYPRLDDGNYHLTTLALLSSSASKTVTMFVNTTMVLNTTVNIPDLHFSTLYLGSLPTTSHLTKRQTPPFNHPFRIEPSSRPMTFPDINFFDDWTQPPFEANTPLNPNFNNGNHHASQTMDSSAVSMSDDIVRENEHFISRDVSPVISEVLHPTESVFSATSQSSTLTVTPFKGILRDIRLNDKRVVLYSQNISEVAPLTAFGTVSLVKVRKGEVSDPVCAVNPCQNGGTCEETFNQYSCLCMPEYRGQNCTLTNYCHQNKCPDNSECKSLDNGYECISNGTFDGISSKAVYKAEVFSNRSFNMLSFYFRTQKPGIIMQIENSAVGHSFLVHVADSKLVIELNAAGTSDNNIVLLTLGSNASDGEWHFVEANFDDIMINGTFDEDDALSTNANVAVIFNSIRASGVVHVGGPAPLFDYAHYRGCLREMRIGGILLPFFNKIVAKTAAPEYFSVDTLTEVNSSACILCYDSECQHHGSCSSPETDFSCDCAVGFEGQYCDIDINECEPNPCEPHGQICEDRAGDFNCICSNGYDGKRCEEDIDECQVNPNTCKNGGTCLNEVGSFTCICNSNYTGAECESLVSMTCDHVPCQNGGTCFPYKSNDPYYQFQCKCTAGYEGKQCETAIDFCKPKPCVRGHCINLPDIASYSCSCDPGFTAENCDINISECMSNPCQNNASCNDDINSYQCKCQQGYTGTHCEQDVNECSDDDPWCHPARSANCSNTIGSYNCYCNDGYIGKNCTFENPCNSEMPICHNDGICIPYAETEKAERLYFCECRGSYAGINCTEELMIDDSLDAGSLAIIIAPIVGVTLLIIMISLMVFFMMARKKRATRGTYSPSRQEMFGSRVEMGQVMKRPPEERLI